MLMTALLCKQVFLFSFLRIVSKIEKLNFLLVYFMYSSSGKNLLSNGSGKFFCSILGSTWKFPSFRYILTTGNKRKKNGKAEREPELLKFVENIRKLALHLKNKLLFVYNLLSSKYREGSLNYTLDYIAVTIWMLIKGCYIVYSLKEFVNPVCAVKLITEIYLVLLPFNGLWCRCVLVV